MTVPRPSVLIGILATAALLLTACTSTAVGPTPSKSAPAAAVLGVPGEPRDLVTGLDVPWDLAVLPDESMLVTLRDEARVIRLTETTVTNIAADRADGSITEVIPGGSAGLRGIALSPSFPQEGHLFLYLSTETDDRVVRYTLTGDRLGDPVPVLTGIPNAGSHTGGRIRIGPDRMLYIGTGDPGGDDGAQDPTSLGGKILRVALDGSIPTDNPFPGLATWSYGHRNPQGFDWDSVGRMYASEFGQNAQDELNLITPGGNYGWPIVEGDSNRNEFVAPLHTWSPAEASPSGISVTGDAIYLAALRGQKLWRVPLSPDGTIGEPAAYLVGTLGRLRAVEASPDGAALLVLTNNTHGGTPRRGDDRIVTVPLIP